MDAGTWMGHLVGAGLVACWGTGTFAQDVAVRPAGIDAPAPPAPHVRPARGDDRRVLALLREAPLRSPTLAGLVAALDETDVVVLVDIQDSLPNRSGRLTLISATRVYRYLALSVDGRNLGDDQIGWLGHELMHALEAARAPEVQDAASMRRFFSRIACTRDSDGGFETTAAVDAGHAVRAEVTRTRSTWSESGRRR
jgi:hypothetical protein